MECDINFSRNAKNEITGVKSVKALDGSRSLAFSNLSNQYGDLKALDMTMKLQRDDIVDYLGDLMFDGDISKIEKNTDAGYVYSESGAYNIETSKYIKRTSFNPGKFNSLNTDSIAANMGPEFVKLKNFSDSTNSYVSFDNGSSIRIESNLQGIPMNKITVGINSNMQFNDVLNKVKLKYKLDDDLDVDAALNEGIDYLNNPLSSKPIDNTTLTLSDYPALVSRRSIDVLKRDIINDYENTLSMLENIFEKGLKVSPKSMLELQRLSKNIKGNPFKEVTDNYFRARFGTVTALNKEVDVSHILRQLKDDIDNINFTDITNQPKAALEIMHEELTGDSLLPKFEQYEREQVFTDNVYKLPELLVSKIKSMGSKSKLSYILHGLEIDEVVNELSGEIANSLQVDIAEIIPLVNSVMDNTVSVNSAEGFNTFMYKKKVKDVLTSVGDSLAFNTISNMIYKAVRDNLDVKVNNMFSKEYKDKIKKMAEDLKIVSKPEAVADLVKHVYRTGHEQTPGIKSFLANVKPNCK